MSEEHTVEKDAACCSKCGRTYAEHLQDRPKHVYQGFVWMPQGRVIPPGTGGTNG